ncbi:methyl-accepting chemotaxis protein [Desulfovibrio aminophilus]|nr:methyl-accepting chemotaxis protein [Desulfovibrio aminophilus]MCM0754917.1 methyl-accepting chemotaxis protein [Desulfovibrio aminophilus]
MRFSIKTKMIFGLLSVVTAIMLGVFMAFSMRYSSQSLDAYHKSAADEMSQVDYAMNLFIEESMMNADMVARHPLVDRLSEVTTSHVNQLEPHKCRLADDDAVGREFVKYFASIKDSHPAYVSVFIGAVNGAFVSVLEDSDLPAGGYDPRKRPWYVESVSILDRGVLSDAYMSTTGEAVTSIMRTVVRGGQVRGVFGIDISLKKLTDLIESVRLGETGYLVLVQRDGVILADPRHPGQNFKKVSELHDRAMETLFNLGSGGGDVVIDGKEYVGLVTTSKKTGWKIIGLIERASITAPVWQTLKVLGGATILALAVLAATLWLLASRAIINPLLRVADFLRSIADGAHDRRLTHDRRDEIGDIYDALNNTAQILQRNIEEIQAKSREAENKAAAAEQATAAAEEARIAAERARADGMLHAAHRLEEVVERISEASRNIAGKSQEIQRGTEKQRERIQSTATAMEQMNATVLDVAKNASTAAEHGKSAKDKAQVGAKVVEHSIEALNTTQRRAEELQANMSQLDDRARAIGSVITVIEDIADQTNLLALNAAIEAARAGEAGRGFAVVADEVRKLAEKTMTATKEVGESIQSIQKVAAANISSMQGALGDLTKATGLAQDSGGALKEIVTNTEESAGQIQSIATAAEEQAAAAEEIGKSIEDINSITQTTFHNVQESLGTLRSLEQQATELAELISRLKVEARP